MTNPLIEEVRAARAARAESLDYDPHKIAEWARAAHAERQRALKAGQGEEAGSESSMIVREPDFGSRIAQRD